MTEGSGDKNFERISRLIQESMIDPRLIEIFDDIDDAEDRLRRRMVENQDLFDDEDEFVLGPLNSQLLDSDWKGAHVTVTGAVYLFMEHIGQEDEADETAVERVSQSTVVSDQRYVCVGFDVNLDNNFNLLERHGSYIGMVLVPEKNYIDEDSYSLKDARILYRDDAVAVRFDNPSAAMIELDIKQGPESLCQIMSEAKEAAASDAARTRYLQRLRVRRAYDELPDGYPLAVNMGKYVYEKLDFDSSVPYDVSVNGNIQVVMELGEDEKGTHSADIRFRLRGFIVGVRMEPDDDNLDILRPSLLMATQDPIKDNSWNAFIVPATSIDKPISSTRPKRSPMGKVAVKSSFDDAYDVAKYFEDEDRRAARGVSRDGQDEFGQIVGGVDGSDSWFDKITFNADRQRFEISIDASLQAVYKELDEFPGRGAQDDPVSARDWQGLMERLASKTLPGLSFGYGDRIEAVGQPRIMTGEQGSRILSDQESFVSGTFDDFTVVRTAMSGACIEHLALACKDFVINTSGGREYHSEGYIVLDDQSRGYADFIRTEPALPSADED